MKRVLPSNTDLYIYAAALRNPTHEVVAQDVRRTLARVAGDGRDLHGGGQVASALRRMVERGTLNPYTMGRGNRRVYTLTSEGARAARAALAPLQLIQVTGK